MTEPSAAAPNPVDKSTEVDDLHAPEREVLANIGPHEPEIAPDIGSRATSGVVWLTLQKWAIRVFGLVTIAILTRLLGPEDFGTVAAASTVLPFFFLIADLGFAAYIVQAEKTDQRMLSTAFWFSLSTGVVLAAALVLVSPLLGLAFSDPQVVPVLQFLSIWVVLTAVGSVPSAILRREMRFGTLAAQGAMAAVVAQIAAIVMAFSGLGVWALVGQSLVAPLITTAMAWLSVRWSPSWLFSRTQLVKMARFGGQVLGVDLVAMARVSAEAVVISSTLGVVAFGYMSVAQRLVQTVQDLTGSAIVPVSNVAFAKIRESKERLREAYLRALRLTYAALSLPLTIVAVTAPLLIPIVFGDGWANSAPVAQVWALAGALSLGAWLDHGLYYGLGKPGHWFIYAIAIDSLTFLATVVTVQWGLVAVAFGFLVVAVFATMLRWFMVAHQLRTRIAVVAAPFWYLVVVVVGSGAAGWGVGILLGGAPHWVSVVGMAVTVGLVHLSITALIARRVMRDALSMAVRTKFGRRLPFLARFAPTGSGR